MNALDIRALPMGSSKRHAMFKAWRAHVLQHQQACPYCNEPQRLWLWNPMDNAGAAWKCLVCKGLFHVQVPDMQETP